MRIKNIMAFNAYRNLSETQGAQAKSLEKLSSGFRINRAADDAAGLVNSENLRAQIGGLKVATRNAQDAISLVQTAEGAQTEVHSILQRMRDLVVQSDNLGTNDTAALKANQSEISQLNEELDRIANQTQFGTKKILDGTFAQTPATAATASTVTAGADAVCDDRLQRHERGVHRQRHDDHDRPRRQRRQHRRPGLGGAGEDRRQRRRRRCGHRGQGRGRHEADVQQRDGGRDRAHGRADQRQRLGPQRHADGHGSAAVAPGGGAVFQVGANANQTVSVGIDSVEASELGTSTTGLTGGSLVTAATNGVEAVKVYDETAGTTATAEDIANSLKILDQAIADVSENRATLGAFQNRMESTIRNVSVAVENLSAAESRIRDTDMAQEMVNFTRSQILAQAGTAMLAQANQVPQSVLSLLR